MATAANARDLINPGDIVSLDPNEIDLGERLRPIDEAWATAIGQSMKREGQIHLVDVRPAANGGWELAGAGGHRVTGARIAGIPIDAKVVMFGEDVGRRREAAENLFRRANDPLERAEAIAELARLHRESAGAEETARREKSVPKSLVKGVKEEADGTLAIVANVYGWSKEIAAEVGFAERTIRNDLLLYRGLRPSVVQLFRENRHPVLKNASQLRQLAKLPPSEQERVAARMTLRQAQGDRSDRALTVSQAIQLERGSNSAGLSAEQKRLATFIGTFKRMSLSEKKGTLAHLAGMLPAGFRLAEGEPPSNSEQLREALVTSFDVIAKLVIGDPVEDDELEAARDAGQKALLASRGVEL